MTSHKTFVMAAERAKRRQAAQPRAISARFDRASGRIVIELSSRVEVSFFPRDAQGLEHAQASQLERMEISPSGIGIHFPRLDADLYVPAILEGLLGSRRWMAANLGRSGGRSRSRAKRAAARANGRLGGRPKKAASGR